MNIQKLSDKLVGMKLAEADSLCETFDCTLRVIMLDGIPRAILHDLRSNRINVEVENGVITRIDDLY